MIDTFRSLYYFSIAALSEPAVMIFLAIVFYVGRLFGGWTRTFNVWKYLALAYFGIFVFRPLEDFGIIVGGVFILGAASMYMDFFRGIFGWAGSFGDVVSAFGSRRAFEDIRRLEREVEALKSQLNASQPSSSTAGSSTQQSSWRAQSQARKSKSKPSSSSGGRSDGSSTGSSRGAQSDQSSKPKGNSRSSGTGSSQRSQGSSGHGSTKQRSRTTGGQSRKQSKSGPQSSSQNTSGGSRKNTSSSSKSSSQTNQNSSSSQRQGASQSQSKTSGSSSTYTKSPSLRDKYLSTLELTPGQTYTAAELKAAWRKMAFKTHPDKGGSASAFAECLAAYKALT